MDKRFLLYGSYGYTGDLIAREAVLRGLVPVLAGRNGEKLGAQAAELGLEHRVVRLEDAAGLDAALAEVPLVLNCAGPFSRTSRPMADACLRTGRHYLDITGEIEVFESLAGRGGEAAAAGVMLLPGVGFDVVPTDCLGAHLKRRLPTADRLALAFQTLRGGISRGTATTMVEHAGRGGMVRRGGLLVRVPIGSLAREIDLGAGPARAVAIPWGDVATAYHSTGIGEVVVYTVPPRALRRTLFLVRRLLWLVRLGPVKRLALGRIRARPPGPSAEQRLRGRSLVWGEAADAAGRRVVSRLTGPEGYALTVLTAVAAVERVLGGRARAGFQTPARAFGPDFILEIPGVHREDIE